MGTRFELVLHGGDEFFLRAVGEEAIQEIEEEHRRLSVFDAVSQVGRVNAGAAGRPVGVDRDLMELLVLGERVWEESGGAFDPAVRGLMERWGHRGGRDAHPTGEEDHGGQDARPTIRDTCETDTPPTFGEVALDREACTVAFSRPGIGIDLGGIAKGYALDRAAAIVRHAGVESALLHGGTSSIVAIGSPPGMEGWRVRLGCLGSEDAPAELLLRDMAASVSAADGRVSNAGAGHIIDPRSGQPAEMTSVAVACGRSCVGAGALADAWATALVVLGGRPDRMPSKIGSAVLTAGGHWVVSAAMEPVFVQ